MPQSRARGSVLATYSRVEGRVARGTQRFLRLSSWLPHEWDFQSPKTLGKFFQIFWLEVFWRVKLATYLSREKRVFCIVRTVFKTFLVFPRTFYDCSLSLSSETNPNTPCHSLQTPFLHHLNSKSSRKRYGFSLSHSIFPVLSISLLILWVDILIWDGLVIQCWVLSVYGLLRLLVYVNSFRLLDLFIIICFTICLGFVDWFIPISFELTLFSWFKMIEFCLLDYIDLIPC